MFRRYFKNTNLFKTQDGVEVLGPEPDAAVDLALLRALRLPVLPLGRRRRLLGPRIRSRLGAQG